VCQTVLWDVSSKGAASRQTYGRVCSCSGLFTRETVWTSPTGSCLHEKERLSKIYRHLGKPDKSREAVRVVAHRDRQEAQGAKIAGRGRESNRAGPLPGLLHTDAAQGWHLVLYVEQATGRGTDAGAWYQRLDPQEAKARELAESWVQVHEQWQEATYGVEEELLMEEARDIKKEARRRGLTERVNALLRERKLDGKLIT
jgi:hypothetical protein